MHTTTKPDAAARPSALARFWSWLPTAVDARVRVLAWISFVAETVIIGTGGAVRLTGSGLGCSEWPLCTPESLVPLGEQGIHGVIEFGNRLMTGVVGIVAILVLLLTLHIVGGRSSVVRALQYAGIGIAAGVVTYVIAAFAGVPAFPFALAVLLLVTIVGAVHSVATLTGRRDLPILAWIVLVGVVAQAFVGGITVLTKLNPFIVGFHYASSLLLVCVTAAYLVRMRESAGKRERAVPVWFAAVTHGTGLVLALTIVAGVFTTGSGPHSGDQNIERQGFDASAMAHVHSWPGYVLGALVLVLVGTAVVMKLRPARWLIVLVFAIAVQIVVGVWQAREGLPELLVGIHMVLAALSAATYTVVTLRLKRPIEHSAAS